MRIDQDKFILIGKVGAATGLLGELKIISFTESPEDIFEYDQWYIKKNNTWLAVTLDKSAKRGKYLVAKWLDCSDRNSAQQWTNCDIAIKRSQLPTLDQGQFYWVDLEEAIVKTMTGQELGRVKEVMETGANPVLIVEGKERILIPYVKEKIVKEVNIELGEIIVDWDISF